jgi:N-acetylglucosaminyl-diphospho-decaprenol L-rhamnosyltransferase
MTDLAVVIVSWNVRNLLLETLRSLFEDLDRHGPSAEVVVVDNASSDDSAEAAAKAFPRARIIASRENLGFVRGNNLALRELGFGGQGQLPRAVYLLNPDTVTRAGATRTLYDTLLADARLGLVGARLTYGDGSFQHSAFAFPGLRQLWAEFFPTPGRLLEGRFNGRYPRTLYQAGQPFPVDFVLGATMMLRGEVVQQVGLLDEAFFMYCEEVDLAWRIHKAGWDVKCVPDAHVVHLAGQSTGQVRPQSLIHLWASRLRLYRKHHPSWRVVLASQLIVLGMRQKLRQLSPAEDALAKAYRTIIEMASTL